ncbi:hypothetical protein OAJ57_00260, partial [Alphaproteobacteria bacterium]|nr:hypothetical protein [Alphaproteobacteria bacterium]
MKYRFTLAILGAVAGTLLVSAETRSGTTSYNMSSLLFEQHPFVTTAPLRPVFAGPLPPSQIRAPARIPQAAIPSRAVARQAAQPTVSERRPSTMPQSLAGT